MSINSSLSSALSGLTAAARRTEVISSNIANAMTEGYARRSLSVSSRAEAGIGGVRIDGVTRHSDPRLLSDRRLAEAEHGATRTASDFLKWLESTMGTPEAPDSLSASVADFEARLLTAESNPAVSARLDQAVTAAGRLVSRLERLSDGIQDQRVQADSTIAGMVDRLNESLSRVRKLNIDIVEARIQGRDSSGLEDSRQTQIDRISEIVPLREMRRGNGAIALYSTGGATLLDVNPVEISFRRTHTITPQMTLAGGALSGLEINGEPVSTVADGRLGGGALTAQFHLRDSLAVQAQSDADALARDLVERFQSSSVDPSLAPGAPGLFTDAGMAFGAANETGLSGRLRLNARLDPDQGGATWRLRDGLGAATPGETGTATLLAGLRAALTGPRPVASGAFAGALHGTAQLIEAQVTAIGGKAASAEADTAFAATRQEELRLLERAEGVDTDQEMQTLLLVEQAYAANARVIQTVDEMLQSILRI